MDTDDDREEAAAIARRYDIMAVPVVDDNHHLMGVIPGDSLFDVMEKVAETDATVLLAGETGTGKELASGSRPVTAEEA